MRIRTLKSWLTTPAFLILSLSAGCAGGLSAGGDYAKPGIAVLSFQNKAGTFGQWSLGDGMSDMLETGLMKCGRFTVLERQDLKAILQEQDLQQSDRVRAEGRIQTGRIKPVRYQIRGVVTDFSQVTTGSLSFWTHPLLVTFSHEAAVVAININVFDAESAELVAGFTLEKTVSAGGVSAEVGYKGIAFGGQLFARTPLGRATQEVIDRAVAKVARAVADQPWQPAIAGVQEKEITLNGGRNHRLAVGRRFEVRVPANPVIDPDTGDVLGHRSNDLIGTVEISEVSDRYAVARILTGSGFQPGQRLSPLPGP